MTVYFGINAAQDGPSDINLCYIYLLDNVSLPSLLKQGFEYNESASLTFISSADLVMYRELGRFTRTISPSFWIDFWMVMTTDCDLDLEVILTLNPKAWSLKKHIFIDKL